MRRFMSEQAAVSRSLYSIARTRLARRRSRRPMTLIRMPCSMHWRVSVVRYRCSSRISASTSRLGRPQLSEENAYSVSVRIPARAAASTMPLPALAPWTWPALRGIPRRCAQRPLPSMMIATCRVIARSRSPRRLDDRLDMLEIAVERLAAHGRQPVLRLRPPSGEGFGALDVACLLELARMGAQVAVADIEQRLQLVE